MFRKKRQSENLINFPIWVHCSVSEEEKKAMAETKTQRQKNEATKTEKWRNKDGNKGEKRQNQSQKQRQKQERLLPLWTQSEKCVLFILSNWQKDSQKKHEKSSIIK